MNQLDQILTTADALTDPQIHNEPITYWDSNRNRKIRHHRTVQPGLLAQLYQSIIPSSCSSDGPPVSAVPSSRPPLAVEALSRHDEISMAVLAWCEELGLELRVSVESNVRALVGAVSRLDDDQVKMLLADLRRWRGWCNVYLGWERIMRPAGVRCPLPDCSTLNTLRVNLTNATATCLACGATWSGEDGSINLLAQHIRVRGGRAVARAS